MGIPKARESVLEPIRETLQLLRDRRELAWEMTKRELVDRYAGHTLGYLWLFLHPVLLVLIYLFVFSVVFRARIDAQGYSVATNYTTYLLAGLLPWLAFQDALNKGTAAIIQDRNLVKQIVFPIEILPIKAIAPSVVTLLSFQLLFVLYLAVGPEKLSLMLPLLVPLMVFQCLAMLGLAFLLSTAGAYVRDLRDIVSVLAFVTIFLLPIVYQPAWVPGALKLILYLNPLSYMIWCYQDVFFYGHIEHPEAWIVWPLFAVGCFAFGHRAFQRVKGALGNFL